MGTALEPDLSFAQGRVLSGEQKREYWRNGFVVLKGLLPQSHLDGYKARFQAICDGTVSVPGLTVMKDVSVKTKSGEMAINKIQDFQIDPPLYQYCKYPGVVSAVQDLIGSNVLAMHTMLINKPPDPGTKTSRHPMHQDLHYFPFRPADRIICAWTAMEKVNRENGCLVLVPGSHKKDTLYPHGYPQWEGGVNAYYHGIEDTRVYEGEPKFYAEMEAGDTVLFHPLLIHGSGANKTKGFRKAISCHYAAAECFYIDVRGTSQEEIAKEIDDVVKKRLGPDAKLDYHVLFLSQLAEFEDYHLTALFKLRST